MSFNVMTSFSSGPATVRMVSNNGPPLPMPMQVPPGHMVQQIVDENGILTHVILSPQPPGMAAPPMTVGYYVCISLFLLFTLVWQHERERERERESEREKRTNQSMF